MPLIFVRVTRDTKQERERERERELNTPPLRLKVKTHTNLLHAENTSVNRARPDRALRCSAVNKVTQCRGRLRSEAEKDR